MAEPLDHHPIYPSLNPPSTPAEKAAEYAKHDATFTDPDLDDPHNAIELEPLRNLGFRPWPNLTFSTDVEPDSHVARLAEVGSGRPEDKYERVAQRTLQLFSGGMDLSEMEGYSPSIPDALIEMYHWAAESRANKRSFARMIKAVDDVTPISMTSNRQIAMSLADHDGAGGLVRKYRAQEGVMRAVGRCVGKAWEEEGRRNGGSEDDTKDGRRELGEGKLWCPEREHWCRCCSVM